MRANRNPKIIHSTFPATVAEVPHVVQPLIPASVPSSMSPCLLLAPVNATGIVLAHPAAAASYVSESDANCDPLKAYSGEFLDSMDDDTNVDIFLNLQNFTDIEMSTDSAKRKRCEDGEEVASQAIDV